MIVDVSHFQADDGPLDYTAAKTNISGAYIKLTQATGYIDPAWPRHWAGFRGTPRGGYHFCGAMDALGHVTYQDPTAEAQHFASVLTKAQWELRPVVDIEAPGADPAWLKTFLAALRAASGIRRLRVYSSRSLLAGVLQPGAWIDPDTDLWVARYNPTLGWWHPQLVLWQHTSTGRVPGIPGDVDLSIPLQGWTAAADQRPLVPASLLQEDDIMASFTLIPDMGGRFRDARGCEVGGGSQIASTGWVGFGSTYGGTVFTAAALAADGRVLAYWPNVKCGNNTSTSRPLPDGTRAVTIEGIADSAGARPWASTWCLR